MEDLVDKRAVWEEVNTEALIINHTKAEDGIVIIMADQAIIVEFKAVWEHTAIIRTVNQPLINTKKTPLQQILTNPL